MHEDKSTGLARDINMDGYDGDSRDGDEEGLGEDGLDGDGRGGNGCDGDGVSLDGDGRDGDGQRSTMPETGNAGDGRDEATDGADRQRRQGRLQGGAREAATNETARPATGEASGGQGHRQGTQQSSATRRR